MKNYFLHPLDMDQGVQYETIYGWRPQCYWVANTCTISMSDMQIYLGEFTSVTRAGASTEHTSTSTGKWVLE